MLFNSIEFVIFFIIVTVLFFIMNPDSRQWMILAASCIFYMWFKPEYILILFGVILVDYSAGVYMHKGKYRRAALIASLLANLSILIFFKYYNFAAGTFMSIGEFMGFHTKLPFLNFLLPIGLSFHTFQALSYTIEVYRKNYPTEYSLKKYALYVLFYPQLVAGPIERPAHLLPQLGLDKPFNYYNAVIGLQRILWGMFKKMVVGDGISVIVDNVYTKKELYAGFGLWFGIIAFTIQIYCDFSGYSDIAIGCARIMGVEISENFNAPYLAKNLSDFWRRWHISLSSWFRDYLFIPLGGSRVSIQRWILNITVVFAMSGLWHGASWTFIFWGLAHGLGLIIERGIKSIKLYSNLHKAYPRIINGIGYFITLLWVSLAWVLFRAHSLSEAVYIYTHMLGPSKHLHTLPDFKDKLHILAFIFDVFFYAFCIYIMYMVHKFKTTPALKEKWLNLPSVNRQTGYYFLILLILFFGVFEKKSFIYFQF